MINSFVCRGRTVVPLEEEDLIFSVRQAKLSHACMYTYWKRYLEVECQTGDLSSYGDYLYLFYTNVLVNLMMLAKF